MFVTKNSFCNSKSHSVIYIILQQFIYMLIVMFNYWKICWWLHRSFQQEKHAFYVWSNIVWEMLHGTKGHLARSAMNYLLYNTQYMQICQTTCFCYCISKTKNEFGKNPEENIILIYVIKQLLHLNLINMRFYGAE
jgi:hypothetical protein